MPDNIQLIIERAKELSNLIKSHPATLAYDEARMKMNADRKAQDLYSKLVIRGREINSRLADTKIEDNAPTSEDEMLHNALKQNPLVIEYIRSQTEYLDLLKNVLERIKNPH